MRLLFAFLALSLFSNAQDIPARWDELTAGDWPKALEKSSRTCILPIGILEKHGPQDPIGSDLIHVREWAGRATKKEYAVVFPDYFYGQINEARHQPGTFALPTHLVMELLDSTCSEIARNGFNKIVIINGHGGNPNLIRLFIQSQLERRRNYAIYFFEPSIDSSLNAKIKKIRKS
jgi:creatinine amidohydrolase